MACRINIDLEKAKSLTKLYDYFGDNCTQFYSHITSVIKDINTKGELEFTKEFTDWYTNHYKTAPTINSEKASVQKNLKDGIIAYYKEMYPSLDDTNGSSELFDKIKSLGYTSISARQFAKRAFASTFIAYYNKYLNKPSVKPVKQEGESDVRYNARVAKWQKEKDNPILACTENTIKFFANELANRLGKILGYKAEETKQLFKQLASSVARPVRQNGETDESYNLKLAVWAKRSNDYGLSKLNSVLNDVFDKKGLDKTDIKGSLEELPITLQNIIAVYRELYDVPRNDDGSINTNETNYRERFLEEVFRDNRLATYKKQANQLDEQLEESQQENQEEDSNTTEDGNANSQPEYDSYIRILNNKMGLNADFMTHLGASIKSLLGSLQKMVNTEAVDGKPVVDLDNPLGLPDVMDDKTCATVLYHYGQYDNMDQMMASLERIAEDVPGCAAFKVLKQKLEKDKNLAIEFFRTFAKTTISKQEVVIENGRSRTRLTNTGLNRQEYLRYRFENALKSTALNKDYTSLLRETIKLADDIQAYKESNDINGSAARIISDAITSQLKLFFPNIDDKGVWNFVKNNGKNSNKGKQILNKKGNLSKLLDVLTNVIRGAEETNKNYQELQSDISYAIHLNNRRLWDKKNGRRSNTQPIDILSLYAKEYLSDTSKNYASNLATLLHNYMLVEAPLNSRNAMGNQSSDVINNSMLTYIKDTLASTLTGKGSPLIRLGEHRSQTKQYDFSNILLEQTDDNGNIISYGLFRKDGTGWVPTSYADSLIQIHLFNGASNLDEGDNILYSKMSKGDYLGTAWRAFFHSSNIVRELQNGDTTADYFMRIPSDAPKNFIISSVRYNMSGLLVPTNQAAIDKRINNTNALLESRGLEYAAVKTAAHINDPIAVGYGTSSVQIRTFARHISSGLSTEGITIDIPKAKRLDIETKSKNGQMVDVAFRLANDPNNFKSDKVYIMQGIYKNGQLVNAKFKGFVRTHTLKLQGNRTRSTVELNSYDTKNLIRQGITDLMKRNGGYRYTIDRNHRVFKQFTNIFRQELTDMATAARVIFHEEVDSKGNHRILMKDGKPVFKPEYTNTEHNGLHPVYHFAENEDNDGKGPIYTVDKNGKVHLTGRVFSSDRFRLFDGEIYDERNFGKEILDEAFNFFKDDEVDSNLMLQWNENGDVILSEQQQKVIDDKIEAFLLKYLDFGRRKLEGKEEFVEQGSTPITDDSIIDFVLNTHLAYNGFNDLFEGDTKFYKNTQTFLKRAKEAQGSGVPYGLRDLTMEWQPGDEHLDSPLDTTVFRDKVIGKSGKPVTRIHKLELRKTFKAITIYNTIRTDQPMIDRMVDWFTNNGVMSREEAKKLMSGYEETTVNDAQSYITFDEWIRRITMRGQLPKYKELIDRVLDETQPLNADDIKQFIQVQKNFYYDQYYNEKLHTISPRQIKNAEFVLVPRLVRGTELEKVAKMMDKLGIDQLNTAETSKAGQNERFKLWDDTGHISQDILDDIDDDAVKDAANYKSEIMQKGGAAAERFNYNFLYTQQETPQHVNSENKAAIQIMKKILDNIDDNSPLKEDRETFFKLYTANIQESFETVMKRFNIQLDENGNIKLEDGEIPVEIKDENGNVIKKGLSYDEFFQAMLDEVTRRGDDTNLVDYCTKDPMGMLPSQTLMPNYFGMFGTKFENIAQSMFNGGITRQTLPGFHAAQVSGFGFRKLSEEVNRKMTSNDLDYHPEVKDGVVEHHIEIRLPASNFGFTMDDEATQRKINNYITKLGMTVEQAENQVKQDWLEKLRTEGLDTIIGYRIPTEGKQSVCIMKIKDFTDNAYGSTIVVPDAFVSQTGADFDIDSIYGIQYSTYKDKNGNIRKYKYKSTRDFYNKYVLDQLTKEEKTQLYKDSKLAEDYINKTRENNIDEDGNVDEAAISAEIKKEKKELFDANIDDIAEDKGFNSFAEFSDGFDEVKANKRGARNNKLLDIFKKILSDKTQVEENLSRSNFDDVKKAIQLCNVGTSNKERAARSPYNIFDQIDYHEDATSGLALKGISVVRDTICSISNRLHTKLRTGCEVKVKYDNSYDLETLQKRFGVNYVTKVKDGSGYIVRHNMFGWSNDNHNVDGKILTSYSSQTTAHILDAIKAGNVKNVNDLTFHVYKTLVDIGSNFNTAVSFIMQPAITRIVEKYNASNSIYSDQTGSDFITAVARDICRELNIEVTAYEGLESLIAKVEDAYGKVYPIVSQKQDDGITYGYLDVDSQLDRLKAEDPNVDKNNRFAKEYKGLKSEELKLLYDFKVILNYNALNRIAQEVNQSSRVMNPDKFGAKQTIYETREVFSKLHEIIENAYDADSNLISTLEVDGHHMLEAIYPRVSEYNTEDELLDGIITDSNFITDSKYPSIAAFFKYATASSIKINKGLFLTQSKEFLDFINGKDISLKTALGPDVRLTEKMAMDFQQYVVNSVIKKSDFINATLSYIKGQGFDFVGKAPKTTNDEEMSRIFGYGHAADIRLIGEGINKPFAVADIRNPSQDEINDFCKLSPAQKVLFIQQNFRDLGLFEHLEVELFNHRRSQAGRQTIRFNDSLVDLETVRVQFEQSFTNSNPLIAIATGDLIKYAFVVEGYKMKMNGISKMIPNSVLRRSPSTGGTNIVYDSNQRMSNFYNEVSSVDGEQLIESYLRSTLGENGLKLRWVRKNENNEAELVRDNEGAIYLPLYDAEGKENEKTKELIEHYHLNTNRYVYLNFGKEQTLYKIDYLNNKLLLIPLNPLAPNETSVWSAVESNNTYLNPNYYRALYHNYEEQTEQNVLDETVANENKKKQDCIDMLTDINPTPAIQAQLAALRHYVRWQNEHITFDDPKHEYYYNGAKIESSVTQLPIKGIPKFHNPGNIDYEFASAFGRTIDAITRDYWIDYYNKINDRIDNSVDPRLKKYPNLNEDRKNEVLADLDKFKSYLDKRFNGNYHVITNEIRLAGRVTLAGQEMTVAGVPDMIVIDGNGDIHIFDMKAKRGEYGLDSNGNLNGDTLKYTYQLNAYKQLLETLVPEFRGRVKTLQLIYFKQSYPSQEKAVIYKTDKETGQIVVNYDKVTGKDAQNLPITERVNNLPVEEFEHWYTPRLRGEVPDELVTDVYDEAFSKNQANDIVDDLKDDSDITDIKVTYVPKTDEYDAYWSITYKQINNPRFIVSLDVEQDNTYFDDIKPIADNWQESLKSYNAQIRNIYKPIYVTKSSKISPYESQTPKVNPEEYRYKPRFSADKVNVPLGNLLDTDPAYTSLANTIKDWYRNRISNGESIKYVQNILLDRHIKAPGIGNALYDFITIDGNNVSLRFIKLDDIIKQLIETYTGKKFGTKLQPDHERYKDIIDTLVAEAKKRPDKYVNPNNFHFYSIEAMEDIYVAQDFESATGDTTSVDVASQAIRSIYRRSHNIEDSEAGKLSRAWRENGVVSNKEKVPEYVDDIIISTAKYVEEEASKIIDKTQKYIKDENGEWLSIDDTKTIDIVKRNPKLRRKYMQDLLEPGAMIEEFGIISDLNVETEDPELKPYLDKYKESIGKLKNLSAINNAKRKFAEGYYDELTDNPLVKNSTNPNGFMSVLDGYYRTNWANAMFNDIQETSNPIIQIALKNFQQDVAAKQMQAHRLANKFLNYIKDCEKRAKEQGKFFDLNHVIDEYGRFKQPYSEKLIEDRDRLKAAVNKEEKGSVEYLKAKLEYDEWKAKYLEQEAPQEYYDERNKLLREALYGRQVKNEISGEIETEGKIDEVLSRYETLRAQRWQLSQKYHRDIDNPDLDRQFDEVEQKIKELTTPELYSIDDTRYGQAKVIRNYIDKLREIDHKYYKYDAKSNFEALVEDNKAIVDKYESSDIPPTIYQEKEDYKRAKKWLRRNAIIEPDIDEFTKTAVQHAWEVLKDPRKSTIFKRIVKEPAYQNPETGVFDPTLVPDRALDNIKREIYDSYQVDYDNPYSDNTLIANRPPVEVIYTKQFYNNLRNPDAVTHTSTYREVVTRINKLLEPYYDSFTGELKLHEIPQNAEGLAVLKELDGLYHDLELIFESGDDTPGNRARAQWIEENVDFDAINEAKFADDENFAYQLDAGEFKTNMLRVIKRIDPFTGEAVPNKFIYSFLRAKKADWIDTEKTDAIRTLKEHVETKPSQQYYEVRYDMRHNHTLAEYNVWMTKNHVYNPYTHRMEPLPIWTVTEYKSNGKYNYYPKFSQSERKVRDGHVTLKEATQHYQSLKEKIESIDPNINITTPKDIVAFKFDDEDYVNKNYKENAGHGANYKIGSNPEYDNHIDANDIELEAAERIQELLVGLANTQDSEAYFKRGQLPVRNRLKPVTAMGWAQEVLKTLGWAGETYTQNEYYEDVSYAKDRPNPMPMIKQLEDKRTQKLKPMPKRKENQSEASYEAEVEKVKKDNEEIKKANKEIHKDLLDRDWVNVIQDFIVQAGTYNAIQDNKYELFYAKDLIKKYAPYVIGYKANGKQILKKDFASSTDDSSEYIRKQDEYLIQQFDVTIRRLVYNQFKKKQNPKLLKWMSTLQSLTSAQYMMLNVRGGIANVTLGESSIAAEGFAREFFGMKDWGKAKGFYYSGSAMMDYILHGGQERSTTLQGAIIKALDVVDYDENVGVSRLTKNAYDKLRKFRDFGYTPQTSGEHMMQNSAMFAMLYSHRLVPNPKAESLGQPKYKIMNLNEYTLGLHEQALKNILDAETLEKYEKYKARVAKDANTFKEYAWLQKDFTTQFAREALNYEQQRKFVKERDRIRKEAEEKFKNDELHPTLMSQLELGKDGQLTFKQESLMEQMDVEREDGEPTDALQLLAMFKRRVVSVNKYIHGVYDKSGRAQFENTFIGSLFMQYHKHLPIGIMKRYRVKGMWSEERNAPVKGMYASLMSYLSIPFKRHKDVLELNDEEVDSHMSCQEILKNVVDFVAHYKLAYRLMPEYDRANIRRMKGGIYATLASLFLVVALKAGLGDDDDDNLLYNLALYEADRLATEAAQYTPFTFPSEAKKLYQSPIAAGSGVTDLLSSANLLCHMLLEGDDFDGEYHSGKFAGENKLSVYIQRRIPIWRGIRSSFIDITDNNRYYKVGDNIFNFVDAQGIAQWLKNVL